MVGRFENIKIGLASNFDLNRYQQPSIEAGVGFGREGPLIS